MDNCDCKWKSMMCKFVRNLMIAGDLQIADESYGLTEEDQDLIINAIMEENREREKAIAASLERKERRVLHQ